MTEPLTYGSAGVDLVGAERHVERISSLVTATWGSNVVGGFGGFAAGVELPAGYRRPVLMMSTDGVGTKLELARRCGLWDGVGNDLVAMCCDDLAVVGAVPIAFVDYLAVGALDGERDARIVASIARACADVGAALVGGETAEHPGVMEADAVDLAGAALGVVERGSEITGAAIVPGDVIVGITSPNLRSNGFSLVRKVFEGVELDSDLGDGRSVASALLEPSVLYAPLAIELASSGRIHGMAHITGGGIPGNLVRPLPEGCAARVDLHSWSRPFIFEEIQRRGRLSDTTMIATFNLGVGFCVIVAAAVATDVIERAQAHNHRATVIGEIVAGRREVQLIGG